MSGTLSPMMRQYMEIKAQNPGTLLFYRLGDFYEMFFEDAITGSQELGLTLTGRDCGLEKRAEMCGVPFHAVEGYIAKLMQKGFKVALCEQLTDPALSRGIVDRGVVRIFTPGTVIEDSMLEAGRSQFLLSIEWCFGAIGLAVVDVSTGEFRIGELRGQTDADAMLWAQLKDELCRLQPAEIIAGSELYALKEQWQPSELRLAAPVYKREEGYEYQAALRCVEDHFDIKMSLNNILAGLHAGVCAAGGLLTYLAETQKKALTHINSLQPYRPDRMMTLDDATRRTLDVLENQRTREKKGSLLWLLDKTITPMGGRLLRRWLETPLCEKNEINERLKAVEQLAGDMMWRDELRGLLRGVHDMERVPSRIEYGSFNGRDALALCGSLAQLPMLQSVLEIRVKGGLLQTILQQLDVLEDLYAMLYTAIDPSAPVSVKEGGIFKSGYNTSLDNLRELADGGRAALTDLEQAEREATGIKNLKVSYNRVFGYYIDITRSNYHLVPQRYVRRQTLASSERYTTPELKELEDRIQNAESQSIELETQLFSQLLTRCREQIPRIQRTARLIAALDAILSLAVVAQERGYSKPEIHTGDELRFVDGRHPVVEAYQHGFVPNDCMLDCDENRCLIITGPNMAGKSTFLRQVALITLMAHIGSFVPARSARIPLCDRIFTRVGASDDLSGGQSTFMVEMSELANILQNATPRSLLILDEIGRGTSTFDGLSIAWATVEHIAEKKTLGAKTLFATHFHELTELEEKLEGVRNYTVAVKEIGRDVIFLHKILRGGADRSFGIHVARLAGLPEPVLTRAEELLEQLEETNMNKDEWTWKLKQAAMQKERRQDTPDPVLLELQQLDTAQISPIEALNLLYGMQQKLLGR